ncbi:MAG: hypothetical protein R3D51_17750 [Hyphomicrobiaceae bacterium]
MWFEGREVSLTAMPVEATALEIGKTYFSLTFIDSFMLTPILETLVYLGQEEAVDGKIVLQFQDISSFNAGVPMPKSFEGSKPRLSHTPSGDIATFYQCSPTDLGSVFEFENALALLMLCSLRRKKANAK